MRWYKKQHMLMRALYSVLLSALFVSLMGIGGAARACDSMDRGWAAAQKIHASSQPSPLFAAVGPITINQGNPIPLTGVAQPVAVSFPVKIVVAPGSSGLGWKVTLSSPGVGVPIAGGSVLAPLTLSSTTPVTATCLVPAGSICSADITLATGGDLSSPGVVLAQTAQPQTQASSLLLQVESQFLLPANAVIGTYATTITVSPDELT